MISAPEPQPDSAGAPHSSAAAAPSRFTYACLLLAFLLSSLPIKSSLWLDETATYWVAKDRARDAVARAWDWSGQSPLYYLTAWAARHLVPYLGLELSLRLPTLLTMMVATYLVYRLARYLLDPEAAMLSALAFMCIPAVSFMAIDARPYALALALLVASSLCCLKWLDSRRPIFALMYVAATTLTLYAHWLFALGLVAQLIYGVRHIRRLAALWAAIGILCIPLLGQFLHFYRMRQSHNFSTTPEISSFFNAIAPPALAAAVFLSLLLFQAWPPPSRPVPRGFLAVWLLFPPVFLFLISLVTDTKLFVPRYYLSCAPAAALLAGYAVSRSSVMARAASAIWIVALAIGIWIAGPIHAGEDWRGASQVVNRAASPGDPVLVVCGFIEGTEKGVNTPSFREVLFAPQIAYPVANISRLPYYFDEHAIPPDLTRAARVFLVGERTLFDVQYEWWLKQKLTGYRAHSLGNFTRISVVEFER
ncbi:MAG: glycosyltransferase family 39 protein [Acidobacteriia bacterium]|nr:glycosyltransferase family 39 protein [Terriglobia bacterium]